jgi:hypothetical protein
VRRISPIDWWWPISDVAGKAALSVLGGSLDQRWRNQTAEDAEGVEDCAGILFQRLIYTHHTD